MLFNFLVLGFLSLTSAAPAKRAAPSVNISSPQAKINGRAAGATESFVGIPFAQPPVKNLRLKPPQPLTSPLGDVNAAGLIGPSCPQFFFDNDDNLGILPTAVLGLLLQTPLLQKATGQTEDCLTIDVVRPAGTTANSKLPVLFWIYGGGFELGSTQMYQGGQLVEDAIKAGKPFVYVAVNHRVGGFGFLAGKELKAEGSTNLGLLDQRLGLKWVADNIAAFGGDPTKVTIWGESAGAISVMDQMLLYNGDHTYKGKPLFRGGIMSSGSIIPAVPVDHPKPQAIFDAVAQKANCGSASNKLQCLRDAPYDVFLNAANSVPGILSYDSVNLSYLPRPDGVTLTESPDILVNSSRYADVPFIVGDQEDEGTLFALFQTNITTTNDIIAYFEDGWFPTATRADIERLVKAYPDDPSQGSPFRTGPFNNIYPQYKRLAAILGDITFTLTRRAFLTATTLNRPNTPSWSFLMTQNYGTPILGTLHGSDIIQTFYGILPNYAAKSSRRYIYNFVHNLDPNVGGGGFPNWPQWSKAKQIVSIGATGSEVVKDDFRTPQYEAIVPLVNKLRV